MHLFFVICRFLSFTLRLGYHAEHALSKCSCVRALQSILQSAVVNISIFPKKKFQFFISSLPGIVSSKTLPS